VEKRWFTGLYLTLLPEEAPVQYKKKWNYLNVGGKGSLDWGTGGISRGEGGGFEGEGGREGRGVGEGWRKSGRGGWGGLQGVGGRGE